MLISSGCALPVTHSRQGLRRDRWLLPCCCTVQGFTSWAAQWLTLDVFRVAGQANRVQCELW